MIKLEQLYVALELQNDKFNKQVTATQKKFKGFGSKMKGQLDTIGAGLRKFALVGVAALAAVGAGLVTFGISAINAGADADEMMSKLRVTFGEGSDALIKDMDTLAEQTGRSKFALRGMATEVGAIAKAMGFSQDAANKMAQEIVTLSVDLSSFNNIPAEEVAQAFTAAIAGEYEGLKRLGIVVNQATLNQELLNMGIAGGAKAATAAEKAQAMYNIAMVQTSDAQGDAIETADGWANQMVALKSRFTDFSTEIGQKLLPLLTPLLTKFNELADKVMPIVSEKIEKAVGWFTQLGEVIQAGNDFGWNSFSMWNELGRLIGDDLAGNIRTATDNFLTFINDSLIPFIDEHGPTVVKVAGDVLLAFLAWKAINSVISGINAGIMLLTSPLFWVMATVAALAIAWETDFLGMKTFVEGLDDSILILLGSLSLVGLAILGIGISSGGAAITLGGLSLAFNTLLLSLMALGAPFFILVGAIGALYIAIKLHGEGIVEVFQGIWENVKILWDKFKQLFGGSIIGSDYTPPGTNTQSGNFTTIPSGGNITTPSGGGNPVPTLANQLDYNKLAKAVAYEQAVTMGVK